MNELLIHKYKPKNIDELLISEKDRIILKNNFSNKFYNLILEPKN